MLAASGALLSCLAGDYRCHQISRTIYKTDRTGLDNSAFSNDAPNPDILSHLNKMTIYCPPLAQ